MANRNYEYDLENIRAVVRELIRVREVRSRLGVGVRVKLSRVPGRYKETEAVVLKVNRTRVLVQLHDNRTNNVQIKAVDLVPPPQFEAMHEMGDCPVCLEAMAAATKFAGYCGHGVCRGCRLRVHQCPLCRVRW